MEKKMVYFCLKIIAFTMVKMQQQCTIHNSSYLVKLTPSPTPHPPPKKKNILSSRMQGLL